MKKLLCMALGASLSTFAFGQHQLTEIWETNDLPTPESVLFSPGNEVLYVSLIDGEAMGADGKGGIAILNMDGSVKNKTWITGMDAPKGLALDGDKLYVADITAVSIIDINSGKLLKKIEFPGAVMLNDVTIDDKGTVYVSDTRAGRIYQMRSDNPSVYLENTPNANGLKFVDGYLYALVGPELWKIGSDKMNTVVAKGFALGGDGLEPVGKGSFLVTCWGGLVYYVKADGSFEKLMDVRGKMNTADLGFHAPTNTVYIPTFNNNGVKAYKLK